MQAPACGRVSAGDGRPSGRLRGPTSRFSLRSSFAHKHRATPWQPPCPCRSGTGRSLAERLRKKSALRPRRSAATNCGAMAPLSAKQQARATESLACALTVQLRVQAVAGKGAPRANLNASKEIMHAPSNCCDHCRGNCRSRRSTDGSAGTVGKTGLSEGRLPRRQGCYSGWTRKAALNPSGCRSPATRSI
jgi:hypothetical protein